MKTLVLIRHAKSSWSDPTLSDFYRGLNKRGKRDAPFMAQILSEKGIVPDTIISSPAKRAKKTAKIMAKGVKYQVGSIVYNDEIYSSSLENLFRILKNTDDKNNKVFLVGHNYTITDFAAAITGNIIDNIPTSGIYAVKLDIKHWQDLKEGSGKMLFFEYPKKFDKLS